MATEERIPTVLDLELFDYIPPEREEIKRRRFEERLMDLFMVFERDGNGQCDVREVGTIVRAMGLNPTEADLVEIVEAVEEAEAVGFVKLAKLRTLILDVLMTSQLNGRLMVRDTEDTIVRAFRALDADGKGYVTSEELKRLMTETGEKLTAEEVIEMLNAAADPETGYIYYDDYAPVLATE